MISQTDLSNTAAYDVKGMDGLRQSAKAKDPAALKEAATQFEAMFINMMMKSMRDHPQDGVMVSQQANYTSMLEPTSHAWPSAAPAWPMCCCGNCGHQALRTARPPPRRARRAWPPRWPPSASSRARTEARRLTDRAGTGPAALRQANSTRPLCAFQKSWACCREASRRPHPPSSAGPGGAETGWGARNHRRDGTATICLAKPPATGRAGYGSSHHGIRAGNAQRRWKIPCLRQLCGSFKDYAQVITATNATKSPAAAATQPFAQAQSRYPPIRIPLPN